MTEDGGGDNSIDRNTKKVRFKDLDSNSNSDMAVDSTPTSGMSRIDKVLGRGISGSDGQGLERQIHPDGSVHRSGKASDLIDPGLDTCRIFVLAPAQRTLQRWIRSRQWKSHWKKYKVVEAMEAFGPWMLVEKKIMEEFKELTQH
ncbi:hypothetical protein GOBAR_DD19548 [Gossypium barbadense]|nr:hypothetical protein GOBAR_DD19548 [Gossypium barbadense]